MEYEDTELIDLRQYLAVIHRWLWLIVLVTFLAGATALVVNSLMTPTYQAEAGALIVRSGSEIVLEPRYRTLTEEDLAPLINMQERRKALTALVTNSTIASRVVEELGSILEPEEREAGVLLGMVKAELDGDLIRILVEADSPEKATAIANAWASGYEEYVNELYGEAGQRTGDIDDQVAQSWTEYQAAEAKVIEFVGTNDMDKYSRQIDEREKIIQQLTEGISARTAFVDEELKFKKETLTDLYSLQRKLDRLIEDATALRQQVEIGGTTDSTMIANALSQILVQASAYSFWVDLPVEVHLATDELASAASPDELSKDLVGLIGEIKARRASIQASIKELSSELVTSAGYEFLFWPSTEDDPLLESLAQRYPQLFGDMPMAPQPESDPVNEAIDALQDEIDSLRQQLEQETATQQELIRARDIAWETYSTVSAKAVEIEVAAQAEGTLVRFAVPATEPASPIRPRKMRNTLLASVVGAMLAVGASFFIEYLDDSIKTPEDVRRAVGLSTLNSITPLPADAANGLITVAQPGSPTSEDFRILRTQLQIATDKPLKAVLVTSPNPLEGKSTIVANLGAVMAQAGRSTIIIDSDMRRPVIHDMFGLPNAQGLSDALSEEESNSARFLQVTDVENLRVLTSGPLPPNPSELLSLSQMEKLILQLRSEADVLLFDSPAALAVTDAALLAEKVDGVLLVVESGRTRRDTAQQALDGLTRVGVNLVGVVLNRFRPGAATEYYYHEGEQGKRKANRGLQPSGRLLLESIVRKMRGR